MTRYALIAALSLLLAAVGWIALQSRTVGSLRAENALLTRNAAVFDLQLEQAEIAADVVAAHYRRAQAAATVAASTIEAIRNADLGECADAPLDPNLIDLLGRRGVRPPD